jgi:uncharacterized membrane protein YagU involved in acid resistance
VQRILIAGTIAAVLDAAFAFVAYVVIAGRYNFESLLQYISSGVLGHDAFAHHGLTGWLIAALGLVLHFGIALSVAAVFYTLLRRLADTPARAVTLGLLYGAAVWMFNTAVVLPLFDVRREPFFGGWYIPFLVDHALFVGLPIALVVAKGKWEQTVSAGGRRVLRLVTAH